MLHFAKNLYVDGVLWLKPWQTTPFILALSVVSYYGVEQPLRRKENSTLPILAALALALTFSFLLSRVDRVEDVSMYHETVWEGELYDVSPHRASAESVKQRMQGITIPVRAQVGEAFANGGIIKKYGGDLPEVVLLGDSHALMWAGTLDEVVSENGLTTSFYAADGTPAFVRIPIERSPGSPSFSADDRFTFQQQKLHYLKVWKPKVAVRWSALDDEQICDDLMTFLHEIGSQVLLIEQPPELFFGFRFVVAEIEGLRGRHAEHVVEDVIFVRPAYFRALLNGQHVRVKRDVALDERGVFSGHFGEVSLQIDDKVRQPVVLDRAGELVTLTLVFSCVRLSFGWRRCPDAQATGQFSSRCPRDQCE
jgi:hypothetical protein